MKLKDINTSIINKRVVMFDITGNKAVYHNKDIRQVTGSIYIGEAEGSESYRLYPLYAVFDDKIGLYIGKLNDYENVDTIEKCAVKNKLTSFDSYIHTINDRIDKGQWINCVEKEYINNYRPDLITDIDNARTTWKKRMEEKDKERKAEKAKEQQAEIREDNERTAEIIKSSKAIFKNGGTLENQEITLRNEKDYYEVKKRSVLNHLFDMYNISVPIRTRGFINERLASITISADLQNVSYSFYRKGNSKGSQKIYDLIYTLIDKINSAKYRVDIYSNINKDSLIKREYITARSEAEAYTYGKNISNGNIVNVLEVQE